MNSMLQFKNNDYQMVLKKHVTVWCLQMTYFKYKDTEREKGKDGKKSAMQTLTKKNPHIVILDKVDFKVRSITRNKEKDIS